MTEYGYINENGCLVSRIMDGATKEQIAELVTKGWKPVDLVDESKLACTDEFHSVKIEPYDAGKRIKYRYPVIFNKKLLDRKIETLKNDLSATDYKIIKCYECTLVGDPLPYSATELRLSRQALRDQINELEQLTVKNMAKKELNSLPDFTTLGDGDKIFGKSYSGNMFGFFPGSIFNSKGYACRRWNESLATPIGEAYGNLDYLRELPSLLGLGCYLVSDNRERRKLSPTDHYKFTDGSVAALDGSMGQYMWCWNAHYYANWVEGGYWYEAVSLSPIPGKKCYYVPEGGTSALGAGVVDRDSLTLCSVVNNVVKYRGGNNDSALDTTYKTQLGKPASNISTKTFGTYARKRGEGWEANWYIARAVPEYLFRIIFGTRHTQTAFNSNKDANGLYQGGLGAGVADMPDWNGYNAYYPVIPTSAGVELADACGTASYNITNEAGTTVYAAKIPVFFGLKNFYGHLYTGVRGLVINAGAEKTEVYVAPSLYTDYNDASVAGLIKATECQRTEGYITKISMNKLCALPTAVAGSASTYYADYFYTNASTSQGLRVRLAGGTAYAGTIAGASYTHSHTASSYATANVSSPQCFKRKEIKRKSLATWQNITNPVKGGW